MQCVVCMFSPCDFGASCVLLFTCCMLDAQFLTGTFSLSWCLGICTCIPQYTPLDNNMKADVAQLHIGIVPETFFHRRDFGVHASSMM